MFKSLKKCLLISASALLVLSVGAGAMGNTNVSARHHYRTHRTYRHHKRSSHLASWYKRNGKYLERHELHHNRMFTKGWQDSHYNRNRGNEARISPYHNRNKNYRNGWVIGRVYADNNYSFRGSHSYLNEINNFNGGMAYASMYKVHRYAYLYDLANNHAGQWGRTAHQALTRNY